MQNAWPKQQKLNIMLFLPHPASLTYAETADYKVEDPSGFIFASPWMTHVCDGNVIRYPRNDQYKTELYCSKRSYSVRLPDSIPFAVLKLHLHTQTTNILHAILTPYDIRITLALNKYWMRNRSFQICVKQKMQFKTRRGRHQAKMSKCRLQN